MNKKLNEQEIALSYSQPTTEQHKLKGGSGQAWGAAGGMCGTSRAASGDTVVVGARDPLTPELHVARGYQSVIASPYAMARRDS